MKELLGYGTEYIEPTRICRRDRGYAFMTVAFGGPDEYKGRDLRVAHSGLVQNKGLTHKHFDAVARHLGATLTELGVGRDLIDEALSIVESTRTDVLNR